MTIRVVLDTNILISALLFKGELSKIARLWKKGAIIPLFSKETFQEFRDVLTYPKFALTYDEIEVLIEDEVLPFFEIVDPVEEVSACKDPDDDIFISCAVSGSAEYIISGDNDLLDLGEFRSIRIITPSALIKHFDK